MDEEVSARVIKKTQDLLGSVIKKPPLQEKLLKKPPFRFLHDVIHNVIKATNFLDGLYTQEELTSENIKDKEGKIAFLQKAIDAVANSHEVTLEADNLLAPPEPENNTMQEVERPMSRVTKATITLGSIFEDTCTSNAQCEPRGASCSEGRYLYKPSEPVSLKSKHLTCRAAAGLG
ncbi:hypothetical protein HPB49_004759 [Dermacentor silvarum]|uniref:Uncharacterized protein n=1 Tax=Dermacentor silvarum TaxID=543639 RepID=A0ACB8CJJ5_DERSI|nr:hypothetical protein HPB49_004759 [Dermacentor silvarum]